MQIVVHRPSALMGMALIFMATGCDPGPGPVAPVRGRVWYKGELLHAGTIVFTPDSVRGASGPIARAEIQPNGTYELLTGELPGAAAGWHRVTVVALDVQAPESQEGQFRIPHSLLPEKYRDPELSGLLSEVKAGQENLIDFHLE